MLRGQKATAPQVRAERLATLTLRDEHDERWQIRVLLPQPVAQPRAEAGPPGDLRAGLEEGHTRPVVDGLGEHRAHDAQVVRDARRVRQQLAKLRAAVPVLGELEWRADERDGRLVARHAREPLPTAHGIRKLLAVALVQQRLVVVEVELRRRAGHEQVDDALGLRREVRRAEDATVGIRCGSGVRGKHLGQGRAAEACAEAVEELAAVSQESGVTAHV